VWKRRGRNARCWGDQDAEGREGELCSTRVERRMVRGTPSIVDRWGLPERTTSVARVGALKGRRAETSAIVSIVPAPLPLEAS